MKLNVVIKITNKDENFYKYMGKIFGSRVIEKQINDRIYDDPEKEWYIYLNDDKVQAFVSVQKSIIKNIYTIKEKYLEEILFKVKEETQIASSIVPKIYMDLYEKCGFKIIENKHYKNFVEICTSVKNDEALLV